jgi:hypothetical protein
MSCPKAMSATPGISARHTVSYGSSPARRALDARIGADDGDVQIESGLKEGVSVELNPDSQIAFGRNVDAHDVGVFGLRENHD